MRKGVENYKSRTRGGKRWGTTKIQHVRTATHSQKGQCVIEEGGKNERALRRSGRFPGKKMLSIWKSDGGVSLFRGEQKVSGERQAEEERARYPTTEALTDPP